MLTLSPTLRTRKLVCCNVNGMIATENPSRRQSFTVKLMPSTATDPLATSNELMKPAREI